MPACWSHWGLGGELFQGIFLLHGYRAYFSQSEKVVVPCEAVFQMCVDTVVIIQMT